MEFPLKKKIALLGITGSIGQSTVEVVKAHPDRFQVVLASAHGHVPELLAVARELKIPRVVVTGALKPSTDTPAQLQVEYGKEALLRQLATADYDLALNAVSGSAGLEYTMAVLDRGKDLALANKESLVMAGHLVNARLAKSSARLMPVDSEHSALWQAIGQTPPEQVRRLILTASGGPFRERPLDTFASIRPEDALQHPTWDMGVKVTLDSATMMNKGLEEIEAHWLFDMPYERITAMIQPQSVIHSLVEMIDGSILAQMSRPSMQLPILYALGYPERVESSLVTTNLLDFPEISLQPVDPARYPLFMLARAVARQGGILLTVMNAANEAALRRFLRREIDYPGIYRIVEEAVTHWQQNEFPSLEEILDCNQEVYQRYVEKE